MDLFTYLEVGRLLLDDIDEIELHIELQLQMKLSLLSYSRLVENSSYSSHMIAKTAKGGKPICINIFKNSLA